MEVAVMTMSWWRYWSSSSMTRLQHGLLPPLLLLLPQWQEAGVVAPPLSLIPSSSCLVCRLLLLAGWSRRDNRTSWWNTAGGGQFLNRAMQLIQDPCTGRHDSQVGTLVPQVTACGSVFPPAFYPKSYFLHEEAKWGRKWRVDWRPAGRAGGRLLTQWRLVAGCPNTEKYKPTGGLDFPAEPRLHQELVRGCWGAVYISMGPLQADWTTRPLHWAPK